VFLLKSAAIGYFVPAMPPFVRGVSSHALCENLLSVETARTSALRDWNSDSLSEKPVISVGQTNVKSSG